MPPQENPTSAAYRPCAHCGDLLPPGAPRCPIIGASNSNSDLTFGLTLLGTAASGIFIIILMFKPKGARKK